VTILHIEGRKGSC